MCPILRSPTLRLLLGSAVCALATEVLAHAALVKSVPGSREVLRQAPARIELSFNEKVEPKFSTVSLEGPDGARRPLAIPQLDAEDPYRLNTDIKGVLEPGRYTVRYRVLSQDGHVVEYGYQFTLAAPDTAAP